MLIRCINRVLSGLCPVTAAEFFQFRPTSWSCVPGQSMPAGSAPPSSKRGDANGVVLVGWRRWADPFSRPAAQGLGFTSRHGADPEGKESGKEKICPGEKGVSIFN